MIIQGKFTSVWEGDIEITTRATLDTNTGEVVAEISDDDIDVNVLEREYFTDENGNEFDICLVCHNYILNENCCSNLDCESYG